MDGTRSRTGFQFTRNFGRYRMRAQRVAIAVSSHGQITGYFVGPDEYEEFRETFEGFMETICFLGMRISALGPVTRVTASFVS